MQAEWLWITDSFEVIDVMSPTSRGSPKIMTSLSSGLTKVSPSLTSFIDTRDSVDLDKWPW